MTARRRSQQPDLPGVDRKIDELQTKGQEYAAIRDERQELTTQEVNLKNEIKDLMHKHKLTKYQFENVTIELTVEKEKVKVRIKPESEDAAD